MSEEYELRPFELDIIARMRRGGKRAVSPKGEWIRGHLKDVRIDYPYRMWRRYERFASISREVFNVGMPSSDYSSFIRYIYALKDLGLIIQVKGFQREQEQGVKPWMKKTYYALASDKILDKAWRRPFQTLYPSTRYKGGKSG
ncbi:MAG: hypothetical protein QXQ70_03100 [Candidatus Caldarchaeum sp.]